MGWNNVPNNPNWEWNDSPPDPGGAQTPLWEKQTGGIRENPDGTEIYTDCRNTALSASGELSKTYWENFI